MYKTFYFDEDKKHFKELTKLIETYPFDFWLLCHEQYNKEGKEKPHYHILVDTPDIKHYNALLRTIKNHYKLCEKNKEYTKIQIEKTGSAKGGYRCFGSKQIEVYDPETYKRYCAKEGLIAGNIPESELKKLVEEATAKKKDANWNKDLLEYVDEHYITKFNYYVKTYKDYKSPYMSNQELVIKGLILKYYTEHEATFTKRVIHNKFEYVLSHSKNATFEEKLKYLIN